MNTLQLPRSRPQAKLEKSEKYFTGKPCKHGHKSIRMTIDGRCIGCGEMRRLAKTDEDRAEASERSKKYHAENREVVLIKMRIRNARYYQANKEKVKAQTMKYQSENAGSRTKYKKEWAKQKAKTDPAFKMTLVARRMLQRALGVSGQKKYKRTFDHLGYTSEQLVARLESQFLDGMSWDNYGEWHIDHIKPLSVMAKSGIYDPAVLNALDNLSPLWAADNMAKGAKE